MTSEKLLINKNILGIGIGATATTAILLAFLWYMTGSKTLIIYGLFLAVLLFFWAAFFIFIIRKKIDLFTTAICQTLDSMMVGNAISQNIEEEETIFVKINHRLKRLYDVMLESRNQSIEERAKLQELISDISHQVKTPVANLKMVNDLLLAQEIPENKQRELLLATSGQLEKLDFLMQAMIKTSRLEAGIITLTKVDRPIYETLAAALGGMDLCQYFGQKKSKDYATFLSSISSFCCGVM